MKEMKEYPTEEIHLNREGRTVRIPYDPKTGLVPPEALKERAKSVAAVRDYDLPADVLLPQDLTPRQAAAWWAHPNEYDIEGIDAPGQPRRNVSSFRGRMRDIQSRLPVYGTPSEEKWVRRQLAKDFDPDELETLTRKGDLAVYCRPLPEEELGKTDSARIIHIDRYRAMGKSDGTIAHEGSHCVRNLDRGRQKKTSRSVSQWAVYDGDWKSVEESCTVAEEIARSRHPHVSGYYASVPVWDSRSKRWRAPTEAEQAKMAAEDRAILRGAGGKPLRGRAASKAVEERWQDTNIARLKLHRKMAISALMEAAPDEVRKNPGATARPKAAGKSTRGSAPRRTGGLGAVRRISTGTAVPAERRKASERRK